MWGLEGLEAMKNASLGPCGGDGFSMTLSNKSSTDIQGLIVWSLRLDSHQGHRVTQSVMMGRKQRIKLHPDAEIWKISLSKRHYTGIMFHSERTRQLDDCIKTELYVRPGDHVVIVDDHSNPFLPEETVSKVAHSIQSIMERNDDRFLSQATLFDKVLGRELPTLLDELPRRTITQFIQAYNGNQNTHKIANHSWEEYYNPIRVAKGMDASLLPKICKDPFLMHMYWRALDVPSNTRKHDRVVRMGTRVNAERDAFDPVQVFQYLGANSNMGFSRHELMGPVSAVQSGPETNKKLYSLTKRLLQQQTSVDTEFQANCSGRWSSVEMVVYTERWYPELHTSLPASFQESVRSFLMVNNRMESRLDSDCIHLVVQRLFELENLDPIPVFRFHQRSPKKPALDQRQDEASRQQVALVDEISGVMGMGGNAAYSPNSGVLLQMPPCQRRTRWSIRGSFLKPLVFRFFDTE